MKKVIKKDFILDEGIIVIHHTLDALYQKYCYCIPKEIEKMVLDLVMETADFLDYPKNGINNMDILKEDYVRRVKYKKINQKKIKKLTN